MRSSRWTHRLSSSVLVGMSAAPVTSSRSAAPTVVVAMVGLWLCWGSSFPAIRVMVATLPPLLASGAIFLTAGAVLAAPRPGVLRGLGRQQLVVAAGIGVCLLGAQGAVAVAEQYVFAGTAALLVAVIPLWVMVLAAGSSGGVGWSAWGLVVLAAAVSWAGGTLWASGSVSLPDPWAATVVQLLAGGLVLLVVGCLSGEPAALAPASVSARSWLALAYLVLIDSLAGFALYNWLLRAAPLALVSTYAYAVPVVAYLVGVLALGEPFHPAVLAGAAAIVVAVAAEVHAAR
jgi:drug/metabolite transporter (DMT)-like permease